MTIQCTWSGHLPSNHVTQWCKAVISLQKTIQMCSVITWGSVLTGELYAQRFQTLIYLHLFTDYFIQNCICSDYLGEIFLKQSVNRCRWINFWNLCVSSIIVLYVGFVVECINHSPIKQEPHVCFQVKTMQHHKRLNKQPIKAAHVFIKSDASKWTFMNHKASCQGDWFTSQSPTPMVAHGELTRSQRSLKLIHVVHNFVPIFNVLKCE